MRKIFIGLIFLICLASLLLTVQSVFSKEIFSISLSNDKYVVGENIVVNLEINNVYDRELNVTWLFWFEPPVEKYSAAPGGIGLLKSGEYRNETYQVKSEITGYHVVIARLFDSNGILLSEKNKQFLVTREGGTSLIETPIVQLTIIIVIILIAISLIIYKRKKEKRNSISRKK